MPTDLTEEDLKGLEGMCSRRQGRRMTVTLDLDVALALVRDARRVSAVERECENIRAELGTKRTSSHAEAQVARCVARIEQALAATTSSQPAEAETGGRCHRCGHYETSFARAVECYAHCPSCGRHTRWLRVDAETQPEPQDAVRALAARRVADSKDPAASADVDASVIVEDKSISETPEAETGGDRTIGNGGSGTSGQGVATRPDAFAGRPEPPAPAQEEPMPSGKPRCQCGPDVPMGSYLSQVAMLTPWGNPHPMMVGIDACLATEIAWLWVKGIRTVASCCGHNRAPAIVSVESRFHEDMLRLGYKLYEYPPEHPQGWRWTYRAKSVSMCNAPEPAATVPRSEVEEIAKRIEGKASLALYTEDRRAYLDALSLVRALVDRAKKDGEV
jgi:hypothetical protein